jgi:hypothetical protein
MCDVCGSEGIDWRFSSGDKKLEKAYLYKVYVGQVAILKICHIHSIELFTKGERRFLRNHLPFAMSIAENKSQYSSSL